MITPAVYVGSDAPTPYIVNEQGIELPDGYTFNNNGHINIKLKDGSTYNVHFEDKCIVRDDAECAGKRNEQAQYIGKSFIPWTVFTRDEVCVVWVQLSDFNQHFGEGNQKPVGSGCGGDELPEENEYIDENEEAPQIEDHDDEKKPIDFEPPELGQPLTEEVIEDNTEKIDYDVLLAPDTGSSSGVPIFAIFSLPLAVSLLIAIRKLL